MAKVLSIMPRSRFVDCDVMIPEVLDVHFEKAIEEDHVIRACEGMEFIFLPAPFPLITEKITSQMRSIRMIQCAGTGFDKVDIAAAAKNNIPVCNSPGLNINTVAEFTIAQIIALQRRFIQADREVKSGNYVPLKNAFFKSGLKEISDIQLGLVGFGAIGKRVAEIAGFLGAEVVYHDAIRADARVEQELDVKYMEFNDLLATSDVVSLHVPLTKETRGLIGRSEFEKMRPGSLLINTARGDVVDQNALAKALEEGSLGGAGIDIVTPEPPPGEHPLLNLSGDAAYRLLITPHIAGVTKSSFNRMLTGALENIVRVVEGSDPKNVVNGIFKARPTAV